jgi:hypothetical protein
MNSWEWSQRPSHKGFVYQEGPSYRQDGDARSPEDRTSAARYAPDGGAGGAARRQVRRLRGGLRGALRVSLEELLEDVEVGRDRGFDLPGSKWSEQAEPARNIQGSSVGEHRGVPRTVERIGEVTE